MFTADAKMVARTAKNNRVSRAMKRIFSIRCCASGLLVTAELDCELIRKFLQDPQNAGLHRMASKTIFDDKTNRRNALLSLTKKIQGMERGACFLAMACEEASCPSVAFAHDITKVAAS